MAKEGGISKTIIRTYQQIASDRKLLLAVIGTQFVVLSVITRISSSLGSYEIPDKRLFGYTGSEIYHFYIAIGEHGRQVYIYTVLFDLFPFMECYTLCLGSVMCYLFKYNIRLLLDII